MNRNKIVYLFGYSAVHEQCATTEPFLDDAHSNNGMIDLRSSAPSLLKEYSTRGGISLNDCLSINPDFCSSFNVSASVFGLISFSSCISSLYLILLWLPISLTTSKAHFLLMMSITPSNGHKHITLLSLFIVTI